MGQGGGLGCGWLVAKGRDGVCVQPVTEQGLCTAHGEVVQHRPGLQLQLVQGEEAPDEDVHHGHLRDHRWEPGSHLHLPQVRAWAGVGGGRCCHAWGYVWAAASPRPLVLYSPGVTSARRGTAFTPGRSSQGGTATPAHVSARLPAQRHWDLLLPSPEHSSSELGPPYPPRLGQQARHPCGGDQL